MYLITQRGCQACELLKSSLDDRLLAGVEVLDLSTNGSQVIARLAYHGCIAAAQKGLPLLVTEDHIVFGVEEIRSYLEARASS